MKKFTILFLSIVFVALIVSSIQSVTADHLEPGIGIFIDEQDVELATTEDSNYQVYLLAVIRNGDGQLINVTESTANGAYIPHKITDHVLDTLMGKKEIIIIDNIRYEKVQYIFSPTLEHRFIGLYPIFSEIPMEFLKDPDDVAKMYEKNKDHSIWKIHYCATFKGQEHGYECIPIFQVLVPTMTLEPHDVVIHQWSILRELS